MRLRAIMLHASWIPVDNMNEDSNTRAYLTIKINLQIHECSICCKSIF